MTNAELFALLTGLLITFTLPFYLKLCFYQATRGNLQAHFDFTKGDLQKHAEALFDQFQQEKERNEANAN